MGDLVKSFDRGRVLQQLSSDRFHRSLYRCQRFGRLAMCVLGRSQGRFGLGMLGTLMLLIRAKPFKLGREHL